MGEPGNTHLGEGKVFFSLSFRLSRRPVNIVGEMKWFLGDDYAQIKYSESSGSFSIDLVMVPAAYRGGRIGTNLISHVLYLADRMEKDVYLSARPIGSYSGEKLERLIAYYQRLGFEVIDRGLTVAYMQRKYSRP